MVLAALAAPALAALSEKQSLKHACSNSTMQEEQPKNLPSAVALTAGAVLLLVLLDIMVVVCSSLGERPDLNAAADLEVKSSC